MHPDQLIAIRHRLRLTQEALAEAIGVTSKTLSRWETGATRIPTPIGQLMLLLGRCPGACAVLGIVDDDEQAA